MILYRTKNTNARLLRNMFLGCGIWALLWTLAEIAITIYLLEVSWLRWSLSFQISTPIIFSIWVYAQLAGVKNMYELYKDQAARLKIQSRHLASDRGSSVSSKKPEMKV